MDTHEDFLGRIRYPGYHDRIMSAEKAAEFIKPENDARRQRIHHRGISEGSRRRASSA